MTPGPGVGRTLLPRGFFASGVNCGVRRYRPDLGLIVSDRNAVVAGTFTKNAVRAAPVHYCQKLLPSESIRAIVTNSGQANAVTGVRGVADNIALARAVAEVVGCAPDHVLTASTGVIGVPLDLDKILPALPEAHDRLVDVAEHFALAIMTTDLVPKTFFSQIALSTGTVNMTGIAKGSGMIHPNMGTMLGYILTDAAVSKQDAQELLVEAVDHSFNMISVDGDTSTNDSVFLMANGASGFRVESENDRRIFADGLQKMAISLAKSIARDGEGAGKLIEVEIGGAPDRNFARTAAREITLSPLIKTAIHGADPNWGRVLARLGNVTADVSLFSSVDIFIQGIQVMNHGAPVTFPLEDLRAQLRKEAIYIKAEFHKGSHRATAWGCDLSKKYVEINASYTT